jgi:hypothetical protein
MSASPGRMPAARRSPDMVPAKERPVFVVKLRPEPHVDGVRALRALLKTSLRRFGLRCVAAEEGQRNEP